MAEQVEPPSSRQDDKSRTAKNSRIPAFDGKRACKMQVREPLKQNVMSLKTWQC